MMVDKIYYREYKKGGKELKVLYYASAAVACDGNLPHVKAICLILRQLALYNCRLPLFLIIIKYKTFNYIFFYTLNFTFIL